MKYKISLSISALCFLMAFLLLLTIRARSQEALASRIAPNILRFHVLAESNRAEDQELKIGVKNLILAYVHSQAPAAADKETLSQWLMENQEKIETLSEEWLKSQGCSVPVHLELARDYFPSKSYGDMVFPCGFYDAARITIGQGEGRNWWCVLYPSLCFVDSVHAVVPASSRRELSSVLDEKDYAALLSPGGLSTAASPAGGSVSAGGSGPADASAPGGGSDPDGIFVPEVSGNPGDSQEKKPEIQVKSRLLEIISGFGS